jgi:hypothetical protein
MLIDYHAVIRGGKVVINRFILVEDRANKAPETRPELKAA